MILRVLVLLLATTAVRADMVHTVIPVKALQYLPLVYEEQEIYVPGHPEPYYFGALIEQESCIWLLHSRCWDPSARLKTSREEGAGLGQITRAYNEDGTVRFDTLKTLYHSFREDLEGLTWDTVYSRPDLQVRAIMLLWGRDYGVFKRYTDKPSEAIKFTDAAYNSGRSRILRDIAACKLKEGCDPTIWDKNVEDTCTFSKRAIYGKRSPCDINREHVKYTTEVRLRKYRQDYKLRKGCKNENTEETH